MHAGKFCTLVLEDSQVVVTQISQAFKKDVPDSLLLTARSVAEAQILVSEYQVDFFILDIHLPDGNGIDFLCDVQMTHPDAQVAIMTAVPLPEYRERAEALGVIRFMEKPVDLGVLTGLAQKFKGQVSGQATGDTKFQASLSCLTPVDIIQLKCLSQVDQGIEFQIGDGRSGRLFFSRGRVVHAECGQKTGIPAFNEIVSWKGGRILEVEFQGEPPLTVQGDWQSLLMNAMQELDEAGQPRAA